MSLSTIYMSTSFHVLIFFFPFFGCVCLCTSSRILPKNDSIMQLDLTANSTRPFSISGGSDLAFLFHPLCTFLFLFFCFLANQLLWFITKIIIHLLYAHVESTRNKIHLYILFLIECKSYTIVKFSHDWRVVHVQQNRWYIK